MSRLPHPLLCLLLMRLVDLRVDCDEPRPRTQYEAPTQATHTLWHTGGGRAQEIVDKVVTTSKVVTAVHRHSRSVHRECLFMRICHPSRYRTGRVAACWTAACHALAFAMLAVTRCREATCNMAACSRTCSCACSVLSSLRGLDSCISATGVDIT